MSLTKPPGSKKQKTFKFHGKLSTWKRFFQSWSWDFVRWIFFSRNDNLCIAHPVPQSSCFARSTWTVKFSLCILIYIDIFCVWIQYWYEYLWYWFFYLYIDIDQWYMYIYFLLFLIYLYDIYMYIYICRYDNLDSLWAFSHMEVHTYRLEMATLLDKAVSYTHDWKWHFMTLSLAFPNWNPRYDTLGVFPKWNQ